MKTIHRCGECRHADFQHSGDVKHEQCCFGGCPCPVKSAEVRAQSTAESIPTWPGYDHAAGRWVR